MRKAFRHTGVLMMLGVVALGLVGAAYTLWFEQLQINDTVSTGSLNADLSFHPWTPGATNLDEGTFSTASGDGAGKPVVALPASNQAGLDWGVATVFGGTGGHNTQAGYEKFNYANWVVNGSQKPLTTCSGSIGSNNASGQANDTAQNNVLNLTLGGLFPFAGCEFQIDIHNAGTVPFHIAVTSVTGDVCDSAGANCTPITDGEFPWTRGFDMTGPDAAACWAFFNADWHTPLGQINVTNSQPLQIHNDHDLVCNFKMILDEKPGNENKIYHFHANYAAYQWNESPNIATVFPPAP